MTAPVTQPARDASSVGARDLGAQQSWLGELVLPGAGRTRVALERVALGIAVAVHRECGPVTSARGRGPLCTPGDRPLLDRIRQQRAAFRVEVLDQDTPQDSTVTHGWRVLGVLDAASLARGLALLQDALDDGTLDQLSWVCWTRVFRQLAAATHDTLERLGLSGVDLTERSLAPDEQQPVLTPRFVAAMGQILETQLLPQCRANILGGASGVGKSALLHGLAHALTHGRAPGRLWGHRLLRLDAAAFDPAAATLLGGAARQALTRLAEMDVIIAVDEAHQLQRSHNGRSDELAYLKHLITEYGLNVILATNELHQLWGRDPAFARRVTRVTLPEADRDEVVQQVLPAKAAAAAELRQIQADPEVFAATFAASELLGEGAQPAAAVALLAATMARAEATGVWQVTPRLVRELTRERLGRDPGSPVGVAQWISAVSRTVVGHRQHLRWLVELLLAHERRRLNPRAVPDRRPFVAVISGHSKVGKSALVAAVQRVRAPRQDAVFRIDGGEFCTPETLSRLLGSPPGYVGHGVQGQLITALKQDSFLMIEVSRLEQACAELHSRVLRPLMDGRIEGNEGDSLPSHGACLLLTTEVGADAVKPSVGYAPPAAREPGGEEQDPRMAAVQRLFTREVWEGIGARRVALLDRLTADDLRELGRRRLRDLQQQEGIRLHVDPAVMELVLEQVERAKGGVLALRDAIAELVEQPLSQLLLRSPDAVGALVLVQDHEVQLLEADLQQVAAQGGADD